MPDDPAIRRQLVELSGDGELPFVDGFDNRVLAEVTKPVEVSP
jgi:hypothetical protein